jgi:uncharacterized DUF497 family protein
VYKHTLRKLEYEWDSEKAKVNARKHGVGFADAALALGDKVRIISARKATATERRPYRQR